MKLPNHSTWLFLSMTLAVCAPAVPCELTDFQSFAEVSPYGVTLASAERVDDVGGYCQLEGVIANADDGESRIRFRFRFPDAAAWNGRFLMGGNGGSAGRFQRDHLSLLALELGYATGQTDTGHVQSSSEDWVMKELADGTVVPNHVAIEDFGHRSVHLTTVVGKQFAEGYYARAPDHSYFRGCSTGGRQGLMAMQRYPGDFDGIIVGAPVFSPARMIVAGLWTTQQVARLIAEDQPLAGEQLDLLQDAVLDACDAIDGIEDQIIDDPRQCRVDPGILQCSESESPPQCLTDSQVEFVRTIYDGPVTTSGERIYPGLLHGGEYGRGMGVGGWARFTAGACATPEESGQCDYLDYLAQVWYQDPDRDLLNDFSIDNPDDVVAADSSYYSAVTRADNPDVTPFVQRGGKAILYHGWSDTVVTATPTVELYEAMESTVSRKRGQSDFRDHVRLFMAPGMAHCGGGYGPSIDFHPVLVALDDWVTHDRAPDSILATHDGGRGLSRPLCPYPQVARLVEPGLDTNEAASFRCVDPE